MSQFQDKPRFLKHAMDEVGLIKTRDDVCRVVSAALKDLADSNVTVGYNNSFVTGCRTILEAKSDKEAERVTGVFISEVMGVAKSVGLDAGTNGHRDEAREPAHANGRVSHERQLEAQREALAVEMDHLLQRKVRIQESRRQVEIELSRVRSEEHACGDPTLMGAR